MRTVIVLVLALACAAGVSAQELLWQGTLVDGLVQVTVNRLDAELEVGIPATGLPVSVTRWDPNSGYATRLFLLGPDGGLTALDTAESGIFNAIPDYENSRFLVKGEIAADPDQAFLIVPLELEWSGGTWRQTGFDQFVVNGRHESFLLEPSNGTLTTLAVDINCERIAIADNGTIALHGTRADQQEVMRVTDAGGKVLFERSTTHISDGYADLDMDSAGTFVEYTFETIARKSLPDVPGRFRVDLETGATQRVEYPLPGGHLRGRGFDTAIWQDYLYVLIERLDSQKNWKPYKDFPTPWTGAWMLPGGNILLTTFGEEQHVPVFLTAAGQSVLDRDEIVDPFWITYSKTGLVVALSLDQTSVFRVPQLCAGR